MTICAKFEGRIVSDCTRGDGCVCLKELKDQVRDRIDAERWRKFEQMPMADQVACLSKSPKVTRQCVDDYVPYIYTAKQEER